MKNPQRIMDGMIEKNRQLSLKVDELVALSESMATAEREYNISYAKRLLELKSEGNAITLCQTLAKGDKSVSERLFNFRVAEAMLDACRKQIYALNTAIDTYRSLLSWEKAEMGKAGIV